VRRWSTEADNADSTPLDEHSLQTDRLRGLDHASETNRRARRDVGDVIVDFMDLTDFLQRYTDDVYIARNPEAARTYIADPCLRHEHGHLVTMSIEENVARVRDFLARAKTLTFDNVVVVQDDSHVASAYNITFGDGETLQTVSGVEIFRVVNGKITETWNSAIQSGAWG